MIIEKYSGGSAVLDQQEVVERLVAATNTQRTEIFKYGWLDVEPVFIEAGWKVVYSKSGYNEPEDSKWIFKKN
jgi:hypothetical protein